MKQISKYPQSLQTPIWLSKEIIPTRILHSKSHYQSSPNKKKNFISDLFISSKLINNDTEIFKKTNVKDLIDACKFYKSSDLI